MDINHIFNLFGDPENKYNENPPSSINMEDFEKLLHIRLACLKDNFKSTRVSKENC